MLNSQRVIVAIFYFREFMFLCKAVDFRCGSLLNSYHFILIFLRKIDNKLKEVASISFAFYMFPDIRGQELAPFSTIWKGCQRIVEPVSRLFFIKQNPNRELYAANVGETSLRKEYKEKRNCQIILTLMISES